MNFSVSSLRVSSLDSKPGTFQSKITTICLLASMKLECKYMEHCGCHQNDKVRNNLAISHFRITEVV